MMDGTRGDGSNAAQDGRDIEGRIILLLTFTVLRGSNGIYGKQTFDRSNNRVIKPASVAVNYLLE